MKERMCYSFVQNGCSRHIKAELDYQSQVAFLVRKGDEHEKR